MGGTRQRASASDSPLPTSAVLVGHLVDAVLGDAKGKEGGVLRSRTALRYYKGEQILPKKVREVLQALPQRMIDLEIVPRPRAQEERRLLERLLAASLAQLSWRWDSALTNVRAEVPKGELSVLVCLTLARLLVIDLALRVGASAVLCKFGWPAELPAELQRIPRNDRVIAWIARRMGKSTHQELSDRIGVSRTTVDDWFHGVRPRNEQLEYIAQELGTDTSVGSVRRAYCVAHVFTVLERELGADTASELWRHFILFVRTVANVLSSPLSVDTANGHALARLAVFGTGAPSAHCLLHHLSSSADSAWRADLDAGPEWEPRLLFAASIARSTPDLAVLEPELLAAAQEMVLSEPTLDLHGLPEVAGMRVVRLPASLESKAQNRILLADIATRRGDTAEALAHARRAVELDPTSTFAHFKLAGSLAESGFVDEALLECHIAACFDPRWDLPKVEVGIILTNAGRHEEAREVLESLLFDADPASAHLLYNLGIVRMRCQRFRSALDALQLVIERAGADGDRPHALDAAAHCAFRLGDHKQGRALAKRALRLGVDETYCAWRAGRYRKRS